MLDVMEAPLQTQHLHATVHVQQGIIVLQVRAVLLKMHVELTTIVQQQQALLLHVHLAQEPTA